MGKLKNAVDRMGPGDGTDMEELKDYGKTLCKY